MECALSFWATGEDCSIKIDNNGKHKLAGSFCKMEWGGRACAWAESVQRLEGKQYRVIVAKATVCGNLLPQDDGNEDKDANCTNKFLGLDI
jgi:hypothetical protein